ncbi:helix-turn-helix transcriptional regulator [Actinomadura violacea]|uniref:YafY family transcriptional regulator n=1 Tax=Actinomadura violacea TaxID=2819934 RepID=A0ABS3RT10_9ACTN|nr:YafY family protein [Actinomadura violacea]MBO2459905.1 YafY family transcriptional regulator [Actinomadura violacea]
MANTSTRTLRLLSLLQSHRYWPGAELAERLDVSQRTLRRDVDRLRELGYPVEARRGVDGGYQLAAGAALPPLVIDDDEAVALAVGLHAAAQGPVDGIAEPSLRVLAKIVQVMPGRLRRRVEALRAMTVTGAWDGPPRTDVAPDVLTSIALACRDAERIRFAYTAAGGTRTDRHVEPHRLVSLGRRWYLVAFDLDRADWRNLRVDRISGPEGTGARFRPRELPVADAAEFVRARLDTAPREHRVEVLMDAPAAAVRERAGRWAVVEEAEGGRCRVRFTSDSLDWPMMALGMLDADFRVLHPPELVDRLRDWAVRFQRASSVPCEPPDGAS